MADVYAGNLSYDYVLGVYNFMERLCSRYPDLLLEGCSGGGGRFDAGMLYYSPQIWCSDNTDAINRTRIQYGTSFFYPTAVGEKSTKLYEACDILARQLERGTVSKEFSKIDAIMGEEIEETGDFVVDEKKR